jgi:alpha-1,6-mannosyltransferase
LRLAAPAAGLGVLALVALCAALAWPDDSPLVPLNGGHPEGDAAYAQVFLAALAAAFVLYLVALAVLANARAARLKVVAALAVAIQLVPLTGPLLLSTDAWTYWDYGRIAAEHDGNPYRDAPDAFPDDPAFPYVGEDWRDTTSVYGPAFTLASEPLAVAAGESSDAAAWIYKALGAVAVLVATGLAVVLAPRRSFACAFAGWNPLLAVHFAGGGHNDAWMAALVLGALALAAADRRTWAGVAWAAAVLVKWVPLVFLPLTLLAGRRSGRRPDLRGFVVAAGVLLALATALYGLGWLEAFGPLARNANQETSYALPHRLQELGLPRGLALGLLAAGFVVAYAWLVREALRGRARLALAACALMLAAPWLVVWYVVWAVPLAAAEDDRTAQLIALALCAYLLPQTIPV